MSAMEEVKHDISEVEETLLAFVAQACPEKDNRASQLDAARRLIHFACSGTSDGQQSLQQVSDKAGSAGYPSAVLVSCKALEPVLGAEGVTDAITVLQALHTRKKRIEAAEGGQTASPPQCSGCAIPRQPPDSSFEASTRSEAPQHDTRCQPQAAGLACSAPGAVATREGHAPLDSTADRQSAQECQHSGCARRGKAPRQDGPRISQVCLKFACRAQAPLKPPDISCSQSPITYRLEKKHWEYQRSNLRRSRLSRHCNGMSLVGGNTEC